MYVNPHFKVEEPGPAHDLIERVRVGMLVSSAGPHATHIPFVLHRDEGPLGTLVAHTPRADPIWRHFGTRMLVVFQGPMSYVRPRYYLRPGLPTYNCMIVHAYGVPRPIEDPGQVMAHLQELVALHEAPYDDPFTIDEVPVDYVRSLLPAIAPFTLEIDFLQAKFRLSQNRGRDERTRVQEALRERGRDHDLAIAEAMAGHRYASDEGRHLLVDVMRDDTVLVQDEAPGIPPRR
ncbi:MAG: FMN-binding negative transcriptional regulator [Gammaproteobacteria bacterium]